MPTETDVRIPWTPVSKTPLTHDDSTGYYLPNDSAEISRLMLQYETLHRAMGNKTHFAPWTQDHYPHRVLDLGTGTGDWVMDFGDGKANSHSHH